jgi:inner membrane protein
MTGRTHDLAALTTLTLFFVTQPLATVTLGTLGVCFGASLLGGVTPDLDQPTSGVWSKLPVGSLFGHLVSPLLGNHRMISHSLFGLAVFSWLAKLLLSWAHSFLLVDINLVWYAFILGYLSHLVMDTITHEGVPWLFPLPFRFGFPPFKFLRIDTGSFAEKSLIYPGLMVLNGYLLYVNYSKLLDFATHYVLH